MNSYLRIKVNVVHPATQHSQYLAVAIQKCGFLNKYITRVYWNTSDFPYNIIKAFPTLSSKLEARTRKRSHPELNSENVETFGTLFEILSIIMRRKKGWRKLSEWLRWTTQKHFSLKAARISKDCDIYIGYDTSALPAFRYLCKVKSNTKLVLDLSHPHVQGEKILNNERLLRPELNDTLDNPLNKRLVKQCLDEELSADYIICASQFSKKCLIADGVDNNKIRVIPYGVDLKRFSPNPNKRNPNSRHFRLLFVGAAGQRKGLYYLIDAVKKLKHNGLELLIVGEAVGSKEKILSYANDNRIKYLGRVSDDDLPNIYRSADVFVLPSLVEGFGLVLLEAMASGLPVIATTNSAGPDLITEGIDGFVVPIRDIYSLSEKIEYFYTNRQICAEMGVAARKKAELYPWSRYYNEICRFVKEISR